MPAPTASPRATPSSTPCPRPGSVPASVYVEVRTNGRRRRPKRSRRRSTGRRCRIRPSSPSPSRPPILLDGLRAGPVPDAHLRRSGRRPDRGGHLRAHRPARQPVRQLIAAPGSDKERDRRRAPSPIPFGKSACPSDSSLRRVRSLNRTCQHSIDRERLAGELICAAVVARIGPQIGPFTEDLAKASRHAARARQGCRIGEALLGLRPAARRRAGRALR